MRKEIASTRSQYPVQLADGSLLWDNEVITRGAPLPEPIVGVPLAPSSSTEGRGSDPIYYSGPVNQLQPLADAPGYQVSADEVSQLHPALTAAKNLFVGGAQFVEGVIGDMAKLVENRLAAALLPNQRDGSPPPVPNPDAGSFLVSTFINAAQSFENAFNNDFGATMNWVGTALLPAPRDGGDVPTPYPDASYWDGFVGGMFAKPFAQSYQNFSLGQDEQGWEDLYTGVFNVAAVAIPAVGMVKKARGAELSALSSIPKNPITLDEWARVLISNDKAASRAALKEEIKEIVGSHYGGIGAKIIEGERQLIMSTDRLIQEFRNIGSVEALRVSRYFEEGRARLSYVRANLDDVRMMSTPGVGTLKRGERLTIEVNVDRIIGLRLDRREILAMIGHEVGHGEGLRELAAHHLQNRLRTQQGLPRWSRVEIDRNVFTTYPPTEFSGRALPKYLFKDNIRDGVPIVYRNAYITYEGNEIVPWTFDKYLVKPGP